MCLVQILLCLLPITVASRLSWFNSSYLLTWRAKDACGQMTAFFTGPFSARRMNRLGGSQFFFDPCFGNGSYLTGCFLFRQKSWFIIAGTIIQIVNYDIDHNRAGAFA
jgi:hypothetical protein